MKVSELIKILEAHDPNKEVVTVDFTTGESVTPTIFESKDMIEIGAPFADDGLSGEEDYYE